MLKIRKYINKTCFVFLFLSFLLYAEISPCRASLIDKNVETYVQNVPEKYGRNLFEVTNYVARPYGNSYEKARAIAYYIASYMTSNETQLDNNGHIKHKSRRSNPRKFFENKVGTSEDFANLFVLMCKQAGVRAGVETGDGGTGKFKSRQKKKAKHYFNYFIYHNKRFYVDTSKMATGRAIYTNPVIDQNMAKNMPYSHKQNEAKKQAYQVNATYFDFGYLIDLNQKRIKQKRR